MAEVVPMCQARQQHAVAACLVGFGRKWFRQIALFRLSPALPTHTAPAEVTQMASEVVAPLARAALFPPLGQQCALLPLRVLLTPTAPADATTTVMVAAAPLVAADSKPRRQGLLRVLQCQWHHVL